MERLGYGPSNYEEDDQDYDEDEVDEYEEEHHRGFRANFNDDYPGEGDSTWRELLTKEMSRHGEKLEDLVASSSTRDNWLDYRFSSDYGEPEGPSFTAWSQHRVYFPLEYDGMEVVRSVSRHPDGKPARHIETLSP